MAKTATSVPITQGSGANMTVHSIGSTRRRQSVIIGDADSLGENLLVELPAHNTTDRGSSIKIGGQARMNPDPVFFTNDGSRTDAWFTLNGQLTAVATVEANYVYDIYAGRSLLEHANWSITLSGNATQIVVPAITTFNIKLLRVTVVCSTWAIAAYLGLTNGVGGSELLPVGSFSSTGTITHEFGGHVLCETSTVNTPLVLTQTAAAGVNAYHVHTTWYGAPVS